MLRLILLAVMVGAPFATYGAMKVREKVVVSAAVAGERKAGALVCNARVKDLESAHNGQVQSGVDAALDAANNTEAPQTDKDVAALCKRSASCRDRGAL